MKQLLVLFLLLHHLATGQVVQRGKRATILSDRIVVSVTFATAPTSASVVPAPLKYNTAGVFCFHIDDNSKGTRDAVAYWNGGVAATDGLTYPGLSISDGSTVQVGCSGRAFFRGTMASNGRGGFVNNDVGTNASLNYTWAECASQLIPAGWCMANHSLYHDQTTRYSFKYDAHRNVDSLHKFVWQRLKSYGTEYVIRTGIVPTNYKRFVTAFDSMGYLCASTQGQKDGYPYFADIVSLNSVGSGFVQYGRWFKDSWTASDLGDINTEFDLLVSQSSTSSPKVWHLGTHGPQDFVAFKSFSDRVLSAGAGKIWVTSLHELHEYFEVKRLAIISQALSGNVLTLTINLRRIPQQNRWRDMTLLISSANGAAISSITVTGADSYSYNSGTGLLNLYKLKTSGFKP